MGGTKDKPNDIDYSKVANPVQTPGTESSTFSTAHVEALSTFERTCDIVLEAFGNALALKDAETAAHSRRTTAFSIALARNMYLPTEEVKSIARAAFLHDIGKLAVPDVILRKPSVLTAEEIAFIRQSVVAGYETIKKVPFLADAAEIVFAHQEWHDGNGYPRGLTGKQIPIGARIVALANALDAMTSDRPYRLAQTFEWASREIVQCSGRQFDPSVVEKFASIPIRTWDEIRNDVEMSSTEGGLMARHATRDKSHGHETPDAGLDLGVSEADLVMENATPTRYAFPTEATNQMEGGHEIELPDHCGVTGLLFPSSFLSRHRNLIGNLDGKRIAILVLDVDNMAVFNQIFGVETGDQMLREIGKVLTKHVNENCYRAGGDEFVVVAQNISKSKAIILAESIRADIEGLEYNRRQADFRLSVSIGVAVSPQDGDNAEGLFRSAEVELQSAKQTQLRRLIS